MSEDEEALRIAMLVCIAAIVVVMLVPCVLQTAHCAFALVTSCRQKTPIPL